MQGEVTVPEFLQPFVDMARDNPLIAVGAVVLFLFLTSLLPRTRRSNRARTYGGRPISYHLGRALGDILLGRSRRR